MIDTLTDYPDSGMQFFTPELYARVNSDDESEASAARDEWSAATHAYLHYRKKMLRFAPGSIHMLSRLPLHDWEVVGVSGETWDTQPHSIVFPSQFLPIGNRPDRKDRMATVPPMVQRPTPLIVSLRGDGGSAALIYLLWSGVIPYPPPPTWPTDMAPGVVLYDEIAEIWQPYGMYLHRLLFSDGVVWNVPFYDVILVQPPSTGRDLHSAGNF